MSNNTMVRPTRFGDSLRALADIVDQAPSILTAKRTPNVPILDVILTTGAAVMKAAADLGVPVSSHIAVTGALHTSCDVFVDAAQLHVFAIDDPVRELHRSSDVTSVLEEQADAA